MVDTETQEAIKRIQWLMAARILIVTAILGIGIIILNAQDIVVLPLYFLLLSTYILSFSYWIASRKNVPLRPFVYIQILLDVVIETGIVYYSGGYDSQFSLLYFLSIITASIFLQMRGGVYIATACGLFYSGLIWYDYKQRILFIPLSSRDLFISYVILKTYLYICFFYLLALMSGFLAERVQRKGKELESATTELKRVKLDTDEILRNMSSGLITVDVNGRIVIFNKVAEQILGYSESEVKNRLCKDIWKDKNKDFSQIIMDVLEREIPIKRFELTITHRDGKTLPIGVSVSLLKEESGQKRGVIIVFQDLTEEKKMEEVIRRADRMAAIGELSTGIAHEIRNPLASISGCVEILKDELKLDGENERLMSLIVKETDRLNTIISDFLYFARMKPPNFSEVNITKVLDEMLLLISNDPISKDGIAVQKIFPEEQLYVWGDAEQLNQMFFNLTMNAFQAMENGGLLKIKVCSKAESPDRAKILFEDTGKGIPKDEISRIFEPFFTTRPNGTGLGLSIVSRIIENHNGDIEIESVEGKGATFIVYLPYGDKK